MTGAESMYGNALYSLAVEENKEESILNDVKLVQNLLAENKDYLNLVQNPAVEKKQRLQLLEDAFNESVHPYVLNFLKILCEKSALGMLGECMEEYIESYHKAHNILSAKAISAVALTEEQKQNLIQKLAGITNRTIVLENKVDPTLKGGVVVRYEGRELDGSVTGRLAAVRQMLLTEC